MTQLTPEATIPFKQMFETAPILKTISYVPNMSMAYIAYPSTGFRLTHCESFAVDTPRFKVEAALSASLLEIYRKYGTSIGVSDSFGMPAIETASREIEKYRIDSEYLLTHEFREDLFSGTSREDIEKYGLMILEDKSVPENELYIVSPSRFNAQATVWIEKDDGIEGARYYVLIVFNTVQFTFPKKSTLGSLRCVSGLVRVV